MSKARVFISFYLFLAVPLALGQDSSKANVSCSPDSLPASVITALKHNPDLSASCRLKPAVLRGDFDGDGLSDFAILVQQQKTGNRGFMLVFAKGGSVVAGAGRAVRYGATMQRDLNFDAWEVRCKSSPIESAEDQPELVLHADSLLVSYHDASGLFYWRARHVHWYQQGD